MSGIELDVCFFTPRIEVWFSEFSATCWLLQNYVQEYITLVFSMDPGTAGG